MKNRNFRIQIYGARKELVTRTILKEFPFDDFIKMKEAENAHYLNTHIIGFLKKYNDNYIDNPINNYEENEWRFIVPDINGTRFVPCFCN